MGHGSAENPLDEPVGGSDTCAVAGGVGDRDDAAGDCGVEVGGYVEGSGGRGSGLHEIGIGGARG